MKLLTDWIIPREEKGWPEGGLWIFHSTSITRDHWFSDFYSFRGSLRWGLERSHEPID